MPAEIQDALASRLQLVSRGETNRGVKQAPFVVLTGATMPAVLSEISFVSNASDESLLLESAQRQRVAEGLYRGIAAYLDTLNSLSPAKEKLLSENRPRPADAGNPEPRRENALGPEPIAACHGQLITVIANLTRRPPPAGLTYFLYSSNNFL